MDEGHFGYNFEETDMVGFLGKILNDVLPPARAAGVKIFFDRPSTDLPHAMIDPKQLSIAVVNIMENAIRYNVANGEVIVKVAKEDDKPFIAVAVRDTGIGTPGFREKSFYEIFPCGERDEKTNQRIGTWSLHREGDRGRAWRRDPRRIRTESRHDRHLYRSHDPALVRKASPVRILLKCHFLFIIPCKNGESFHSVISSLSSIIPRNVILSGAKDLFCLCRSRRILPFFEAKMLRFAQHDREIAFFTSLRMTNNKAFGVETEYF